MSKASASRRRAKLDEQGVSEPQASEVEQLPRKNLRILTGADWGKLAPWRSFSSTTPGCWTSSEA